MKLLFFINEKTEPVCEIGPRASIGHLCFTNNFFKVFTHLVSVALLFFHVVRLNVEITQFLLHAEKLFEAFVERSKKQIVVHPKNVKIKLF